MENSVLVAPKENLLNCLKYNEFFCCPVKYMHKDYFKKIKFGRYIYNLRQAESTHASLSKYLMSEFNLNLNFDVSILSPEIKRLMVLTGEELDSVSKFLSAYFYSGVIRNVIDKRKVIYIKNNIGVDAYNFSIYRAPVIKINEINLKGMNINDVRSIKLFGRSLFVNSVRQLPDQIAKRIMLKLPCGYGDDDSRFEGALNVKSLNIIMDEVLP